MDLSGFLRGGAEKKRAMDLSGFLGGGPAKKRRESPPARSPTTPGATVDVKVGTDRRRPPSSTVPPGDGSGAVAVPCTDRPAEMAAVAGAVRGGVVLRACADAADVDAVRTLNAGLLPLPCPERVYRNILGTDPRLCALACARWLLRELRLRFHRRMLYSELADIVGLLADPAPALHRIATRPRVPARKPRPM